MDNSADDDRYDDVFAYDSYVHDGGTGSYIPELWLPVDETTRFNLHSPDVIHDFGIPVFLMRMDVVPGRVNHYVIKPTRTGVWTGRCYELCGVYHSRMLFEVHVVSREDYEQHLQDLEDAGQTSDLPLLGGEEAYTQDGLEPDPWRERNDRHRVAPDHRRQPPPTAGPADRPGPDHDRPQGDRQPLPRHVVLLVPASPA